MSSAVDIGLSDEQLLRYSRHVLLDAIGVEGQERLLRSHALVIGAGGLGSPVALFLGSAGIGTITIVDDDTVDLTNLQRQIAHRLASVGEAKVVSAAAAIAAINPEVDVIALRERAGPARLDALVAAADVVVDCSDNYATRQAVNAACVAHARPLVAGAAIGFDGQISVYDSRGPHPCYACVFPPDERIRGGALRDDGRVRAAGRHRRQHAGGRSAEAAGRHRHLARRAAADARQPDDGVDRDPDAARSRLPGLRRRGRGRAPRLAGRWIRGRPRSGALVQARQHELAMAERLGGGEPAVGGARTCSRAACRRPGPALISRCSRPDTSTSMCSLIVRTVRGLRAELDHRQDRVADHVALAGREEVDREARRRAERDHLGRRATTSP